MNETIGTQWPGMLTGAIAVGILWGCVVAGCQGKPAVPYDVRAKLTDHEGRLVELEFPLGRTYLDQLPLLILQVESLKKRVKDLED